MAEPGIWSLPMNEGSSGIHATAAESKLAKLSHEVANVEHQMALQDEVVAGSNRCAMTPPLCGHFP
eukprot:CAMPEP_0174376072 /NCGR_PEP_ID=MMETSP0811_2-20130205/116907_1 /TAXON_ID=73025 ORGANISM="Eutreptiella gymnastica-like, Strain CCMP1594" /NCGR_SAMPLE_ID=MMETSP0811_2 /ASSEMBLY_ACC=CAM_ASM_000667 /LENGTH=65 /DNA_ID=CAMNT_0015526921 /DNA_START=261 /DNA_END=455 /DNA_ORIENTATION=-